MLIAPGAQSPLKLPARTGPMPRREEPRSPGQVDQANLSGLSAPPPSAAPPSAPPAGDLSAARTQRILETVFGQFMTPEKLTDSVKDCLPGTLPIVQISAYDNPEFPPAVSFSVDWRDERGEQVASTAMLWTKQPDGALNLRWGDVWLDPEQRTHGFLENIAESQIKILRQQNQHSNNRLELAAGGSGKIGQSEKEVVGKYLWARLGLFEFSNDATRDRMAASFNSWLREKAKDHPALTPAVLDGLEASSKTWTRPEQYAEFDIPYVKLSLERHDGRTRSASLGKAFLLDPKTPGWHGHSLVNQLEPAIWERAERALAFGGRQHTESDLPTPSYQQVDAPLAAQAGDLQKPALQRMKHAASLAALRGHVNTDELARQFADLGSPEQLQGYWKAAPADLPVSDRVMRTVQSALEVSFTSLVTELEGQLGKQLDPQWVRDVKVRNYGDMAALASALRQGAADHTL